MPKIKPSFSWLPVYLSLAVALVALAAYFFFMKPRPQAISSGTTIPVAPQAVTPSTPQEQPSLDTPHLAADPALPADSYQQAPMENSLQDPCLDIIKKLDSFFVYLDEQDYIQAYRFPQGSKEYLAKLASKALSKPPKQLSTTPTAMESMANHAHFFRTLGSQNVFILRDILLNEPDRVEEMFNDFYSWYAMTGQCQHRLFAITPELPALYSYALFFINSPGGQAYLARRAPTVRLLARYYSLLIIQQAQELGLDKSSLDTAQIVGALIREIEANSDLAFKDTYLTTLYKLREEAVIL